MKTATMQLDAGSKRKMTKEERAAYKKKWYEANRERQDARSKEYCKNHGEQRAATTKKYREANKTKNAIATKKYREANPEKFVAWHLKRKYNLTLEEWEAFRKAQDNRCAICGRETKLCVDHDHANGHIRGLLCYSCNFALGGFKDKPEILMKAIQYLENTKC